MIEMAIAFITLGALVIAAFAWTFIRLDRLEAKAHEHKRRGRNALPLD